MPRFCAEDTEMNEVVLADGTVETDMQPRRGWALMGVVEAVWEGRQRE